MGHLFGCFDLLHQNVLLILSTSCSPTCGHYLSARIITVSCLQSTIIYHSTLIHCLFLCSYSRTTPVRFVTIHIAQLREIYFRLLCVTVTFMHLLPPPLAATGTLTSFLILVGSGHRHKIAVSASSRSPLRDANTFPVLKLRSIHRISKCVLFF